MDLLQHATDDQIALAGCFLALVLSIALMIVSTFVRRGGSESRVNSLTTQRVQRLDASRKSGTAAPQSTREAA